MPALQRDSTSAEERLLGDLRQSVPQNGRIHLHIIELLGIVLVLALVASIPTCHEVGALRPSLWFACLTAWQPTDLCSCMSDILNGMCGVLLHSSPSIQIAFTPPPSLHAHVRELFLLLTMLMMHSPK